MKVLLINGSPRVNGCTYTALCFAAEEIEKTGIEAEIFQLGDKQIKGCQGCGYCRANKKCRNSDDCVNTVIEKAKESDGFIFGSPVYYGGVTGIMSSLLERIFYAGGYAFEYKPGAAVVSCRRGGEASAFERLNKFFSASNMPIVPSLNWNMVHGNTPEEVRQDLEGVQTMRILGRNMAWLINCIRSGNICGFNVPEKEERQRTNFIR